MWPLRIIWRCENQSLSGQEFNVYLSWLTQYWPVSVKPPKSRRWQNGRLSQQATWRKKKERTCSFINDLIQSSGYLHSQYPSNVLTFLDVNYMFGLHWRKRKIRKMSGFRHETIRYCQYRLNPKSKCLYCSFTSLKCPNSGGLLLYF